MSTVVLKCNSCGSILVVNINDLWKIVRCNSCGSADIVNIDEEFSNSEVVGEENE